MSQRIIVPCPATDGATDGTRWVHNRQVKKWFMACACPYCKQVHAPENIREDHLVVPAFAA